MEDDNMDEYKPNFYDDPEWNIPDECNLDISDKEIKNSYSQRIENRD